MQWFGSGQLTKPKKAVAFVDLNSAFILFLAEIFLMLALLEYAHRTNLMKIFLFSHNNFR